jgi:hypothetical protein
MKDKETFGRISTAGGAECDNSAVTPGPSAMPAVAPEGCPNGPLGDLVHAAQLSLFHGNMSSATTLALSVSSWAR